MGVSKATKDRLINEEMDEYISGRNECPECKGTDFEEWDCETVECTNCGRKIFLGEEGDW